MERVVVIILTFISLQSMASDIIRYKCSPLVGTSSGPFILEVNSSKVNVSFDNKSWVAGSQTSCLDSGNAICFRLNINSSWQNPKAVFELILEPSALNSTELDGQKLYKAGLRENIKKSNWNFACIRR